MKAAICTFMVMLPVVLAGCASSSMVKTEAPQHAPQKITLDKDYVGAVNMVARQRGVRVTWINPPTRRSSEQVASLPE